MNQESAQDNSGKRSCPIQIAKVRILWGSELSRGDDSPRQSLCTSQASNGACSLSQTNQETQPIRAPAEQSTGVGPISDVYAALTSYPQLTEGVHAAVQSSQDYAQCINSQSYQAEWKISRRQAEPYRATSEIHRIFLSLGSVHRSRPT